MESQGLLFIPDISGFTKFINETDLEHSRLIIEELLEILINANGLNLEISEIEGDAILFYKFGKPPSLIQLYQQVQNMFHAFHSHLIAYDSIRYCQCKACTSAINLTLKVITHYGEFTGYKVRQFSKLIGKDVIVAHQLLKNDIDQHEYWLLTDNVPQVSDDAEIFSQDGWRKSNKHLDDVVVQFRYTQLGELKKKIPSYEIPRPNLADKIKLFSLEREYKSDIISLFHATGDFNYRKQWKEGVLDVEEVNHFLPRIGMRCRYIMKDGETMIKSSGYVYDKSQVEFCETDESTGHLTYYLLEKIDELKSRIRLTYFIDKEILLTDEQKIRIRDTFEKSLENLDGLVNQINYKYKLPGN